MPTAVKRVQALAGGLGGGRAWLDRNPVSAGIRDGILPHGALDENRDDGLNIPPNKIQ